MLRLTEQPEPLQRAVAAWTTPIDYAVRFREYHILRQRPGRSLVESGYKRDIDEDWTSGVEFNYCPWTGHQTPGSLRAQWFEIVNDELGLEDFDFLSPVKDLPKEFVCEDWWINREIGRIDDPKLDKIEHMEFTIEEPDEDTPLGLRRPTGLLPHSCVPIALGFEEGNHYEYLEYLPWQREFGIRILDPSKPADFQPLEIEPILFCPYCGEKLPESLKAERDRRL